MEKIPRSVQEELDEVMINESYRGKLWSKAIQTAMTAPFPEVAMQYLLNRVHQKARIEVLEEVLSRKLVAINEKEAVSPMGISTRTIAEDIPPFTNENVRNLVYIKAWDVEKMLSREKDPSKP